MSFFPFWQKNSLFISLENRHSLKEVLDTPSVMALIKDTKAAQEVIQDKDVSAFCYCASYIAIFQCLARPRFSSFYSVVLSYQVFLFLSGPSSEGFL